MREYNLTEEQLNVECTDEHILQVGETIAWKAVGNYLLTPVELEDIETDGHNEPDRRHKMLRKWKQKCSSKATYKALIEAMLKAKRRDQAGGVCALIPPQPPQQRVGEIGRGRERGR